MKTITKFFYQIKTIHFIKILMILSISQVLQNCTNENENNDSKPITENTYTEEKKQSPKLPSYIIDSVEIKDTTLDNICFSIEQSFYPKIKELQDNEFEQKINNYFQSIYQNMLKKAQKGVSCKDTNDYGIPSIFPTFRSKFEILSYNDKILSVIIEGIQGAGGGGNAFDLYSKVVNVDIQNKKILTKNDFMIDKSKIDELNQQIKIYFDKNFTEPNSNEKINYPFIDSKKYHSDIKWKDVEFGIRNDSIVLVLIAYPTAHYTYSIYSIPTGMKMKVKSGK